LSGEDSTVWATKQERADVFTRWIPGYLPQILGGTAGDRKPSWERKRKLLSPALLQSSTLNPFIQPIVQAVDSHLGQNSKQSVLDPSTVANIAFDLGWLFIVGNRGFQYKEESKKLYKSVSAAISAVLPSYIPGSAVRKALQAKKKLGEIIQCIIESDPSAITDPNCALSAIVGSDQKLSKEQQMQGNSTRLFTFLFAAHHTTLRTFHGLFQEFMHNPNIIQQLSKEIRNSGMPSTVTEVNKFGYLQSVIHEALRFYGSDGVFRKCAEPMQYNGLHLPRGTIIFIHMGFQHYRVNNPMKFTPEREDTYKWEPFGTPMRNCLGRSFAQLELKMVLIALLNKWNMEVVEEHKGKIRRDSNIMDTTYKFKLTPHIV